MLLKAIMAEDIEMMEELGLYECSPEDFSLCAFSDASKMDIMGIVQQGLELIEMEG
jgi:Na+-transporting NADH:ubiquinone oxidoreductase subunit A